MSSQDTPSRLSSWAEISAAPSVSPSTSTFLSPSSSSSSSSSYPPITTPGSILAVTNALIRSAHNRQIARRRTYQPPATHSRSDIHAITLMRLVGKMPLPSASMRHPAECLTLDPHPAYGTWKASNSLAHMKMTLVEYRDKMLSPEEQRVALPREIRLAMSGQLADMRGIWTDVIMNNNQRKMVEEEDTSPCQSVFEEDDDEEEVVEEVVEIEMVEIKKDDIKKIDVKEVEVEVETDTTAEKEIVKELLAPPSPTSQWNELQERLKRAADTMRLLASQSSLVIPDSVASTVPAVPAIPEFRKQPQPLKVIGRMPPPRPVRADTNALALAGLEKYRGCNCGPFPIKCRKCRPSAMRTAVEENLI